MNLSNRKIEYLRPGRPRRMIEGGPLVNLPGRERHKPGENVAPHISSSARQRGAQQIGKRRGHVRQVGKRRGHVREIRKPRAQPAQGQLQPARYQPARRGNLGIDGLGLLHMSRHAIRQLDLPDQERDAVETGNFAHLPQALHVNVRKARAAAYRRMMHTVKTRPALPDGVLPDTSHTPMHVPLGMRNQYGLELYKAALDSGILDGVPAELHTPIQEARARHRYNMRSAPQGQVQEEAKHPNPLARQPAAIPGMSPHKKAVKKRIGKMKWVTMPDGSKAQRLQRHNPD
jgi:hypothetical protein